MSRPESPLKSLLPDEDMIKKLKALLIKEKRVNKDNVKIVNDYKADIEQKSVENRLLIAQIQRLSENIGDLDFSENNKTKELSDLKIIIDKLQQENERLAANNVDEFVTKLKFSLRLLINDNKELFGNHHDLIETDDLDKLGNNICDLFGYVKESLQSGKEVRNVLQDGLERITVKCNHLETVISKKEENISSLVDCQTQLQNINSELNQREEQIRRLEVLIEDNRNISRALETERDQLQNDLVDLRQRHEEKEGYLIEEYREAQQSLENYRIFSDKQSAEKANEIERLRKCLSDCQRTVTQEQFLIDCRLCRDIDSLFERLQLELNLGQATMAYEDIVTAVIDQYTSAKLTLNDSVDRLERNESLCRQQLSIMTEKVSVIEQSLSVKIAEENIQNGAQNDVYNSDSLKRSLSEKIELNEKLINSQMKTEEKLCILTEEMQQLKRFKQNIENLFTNLDDSSSVIDEINKLISLNHRLTNEIQEYKFNNNEQKNQFEQLIHDRDSYINELTMKLEGASKDADKERFNLINQLTAEFKNVTTDFQSDVNNIDALKQSLSDKNKIIEDLTNALLEKEEKLFSQYEEMKKFKLFDQELADLFQLDDSSTIIDEINKSLSLNNLLTNEIRLCNNNKDELKTRFEESLQQKEREINELSSKLAEAGKHVNHNDLMNLEMAEIDKTLINLNNQLLMKSTKITEVELTIRSHEETIEELTRQVQSAQRQNQLFDERNNKMKQMLVKTKRELTDYKSQWTTLQERESLHQNELELINEHLDETKVLLSESIAEKEKLQERYNSFSKKMDSITKNKEIIMSSLRSQIETMGNNYKSLQQEFDSYKVKVQTAFSTKLRAPSTFSDFMTLPTSDLSNTDDMNVKSYKKQVADLEMNVDDLKLDLREKEENVSALKNDLDILRWDNEKLSDKLKLITKENNELTIKLEQFQNDIKLQEISHSDMLERFNSEKEKLSIIYQKQIESIRSNYENEIESLTQRIDEKEIEKVKIQEEIWDCREQLKTADHKLGQIRIPGNELNRSIVNDVQMLQFKSPLGQERQQGEGMEMNNESENVNFQGHNKIVSPKQFSKSAIHNNAFVSLDQLLNSHNENDQQLNDEFIAALKAESSSYRRKNEHLTELLNDTEATVSRLTEQSLLLKGEIRRLENNEERDNTLRDRASREYLKNVIIKFLHYETKADERQQLVPVLVTLLSLEHAEKDLLLKFCRMCLNTKAPGEGWSSYFSWTGIS